MIGIGFKYRKPDRKYRHPFDINMDKLRSYILNMKEADLELKNDIERRYMKSYTKDYNFNGVGYTINVSLDHSVERRINGSRFHKVTLFRGDIILETSIGIGTSFISSYVNYLEEKAKSDSDDSILQTETEKFLIDLGFKKDN